MIRHVQRDVTPTSPPPPPPPSGPPPAYSASEPPRSRTSAHTESRHDDEEPPPAYTAVDFDPRALTPGQVDELTHKLAGPITRLLRTELRLERERIGKLRDPRR